MAASNLNLGKASGGVLNIQPADGTTTTNLVLPAINGTVVAADSNGNVGIGTNNVFSTGGKTLHLYNNLNDGTTNSNSTLYLESINRNSNVICKGLNVGFQGWDSSSNIAGLFGIDCVNKNATITTNGSERMRIDSNGNVGIGVAPSAWNSAIKSFQVGNGASLISPSATETVLGANYYRNTSDVNTYINTGYATKYHQTSGQHQWFTAPSGTAGNAITWNNAMTLDQNSGLSVFGNLVSGYNGSVYSGSGSTFIGARAVDANTYTLLFARNIADTNYVYSASVGGVLKSAILANGNFQSATNSYGSTSDAKLKENIQDASPKLDKLMQVQVRTFNYIGQEEKQIGVVAQEIEKIFPSIVYETKDTKQVEVKKEREITLEDGTIDVEKYTEIETVETGEVTKNVKYSVIYMMMLKAMQEQNEIIKDLKSRIEILEAK